MQWVSDSSVPISHATFSCDSQTVYASFVDGTIGIFDASVLALRCQIKPSAYLPADIRYTLLHYLVTSSFSRSSCISFLGFPHRKFQVSSNIFFFPAVASCSYTVYPLVIAAHPQKPTQFAVGLSNGEVHVLEPLEPEGTWGILPMVKRNLESSVPAKSEFWGFLYK